MKLSLRELRLWRAETRIPKRIHGLKIFRSFEQGSWLGSAAERVPEEILTTVQAWELIMTEILQNLKPFLHIEQDILIEKLFYSVTCVLLLTCRTS